MSGEPVGNEGHLWMKACDVHVGDFIHCWGEDYEITRKVVNGNRVEIQYKDAKDGSIKSLHTWANKEYIIRPQGTSKP